MKAAHLGHHEHRGHLTEPKFCDTSAWMSTDQPHEEEEVDLESRLILLLSSGHLQGQLFHLFAVDEDAGKVDRQGEDRGEDGEDEERLLDRDGGKDDSCVCCC